MEKAQVSILVVVGVFIAAIIVLLVTFAINKSDPKIDDKIRGGYPECGPGIGGCEPSYTSCCNCTYGAVKECVSLEEKQIYENLMKNECTKADLPACLNEDKCNIPVPSCACVQGRCVNV